MWRFYKHLAVRLCISWQTSQHLQHVKDFNWLCIWQFNPNVCMFLSGVNGKNWVRFGSGWIRQRFTLPRASGRSDRTGSGGGSGRPHRVGHYSHVQVEWIHAAVVMTMRPWTRTQHWEGFECHPFISDPSCFLSLSGLYRRKSKQALRDYKKVLVQLETLEINVGDQCRKEFTGMSALPFILTVCSRKQLTICDRPKKQRL